MSVLSPLVEKLGLVLPSLNGPHSGCPNVPQPCLSLARVKMSVQPMGLPGYPRASAIGLGMAIVSGVTMNGSPVVMMGSWPESMSRWFTTPPQLLAAGDQIAGLGPSVLSSQLV